MFAIDGYEWPIPCDITRKADVTASDISGLMLDGSYFNDVLGTYMVYTVKIVVPFDMLDDYSALYEILSQPVDGHQCVFPYNGSTVTVTGRVGNLQDVYVRMPVSGRHWRGIQFDITANHPTKEMSLSQVISRGRAPLPDVAMPSIGDTYTYTADGWVKQT